MQTTTTTYNASGNIVLPKESLQNWHGLASDKWSLPERRHLKANDQLQDKIIGVDPVVLGRKHFVPTNSDTYGYKATLKVFPDRANRESNQKETIAVQKAPYEPTRRPYGHKEKVHITSKESGHYDYSRTTTKVFPNVANKPSSREFTLEKNMGHKKNVEFLDDQRNDLPVTSLGDKNYKFPEYSGDFFKDGGLVPGSSMKKRKPKADTLQASATGKIYKAGSMTAKEREAKEVISEDRKAVLDLGDWEQNTLKEANPKWRDPDAVEVELPVKVETKAQTGAKGKKAGKK